QSNMKQKQIELMKQGERAVQEKKQDFDLWSEMSFSMTSEMMDKRFRESKQFIGSGGQSGSIRLKKSLSEQERQLQYLTQQNMLKSRTKYENTVSQYNQRLTDQKMKSSIKKIDL